MKDLKVYHDVTDLTFSIFMGNLTYHIKHNINIQYNIL